MSEINKMPRIVRLDDSDTQVYDRTAEAGEWAVTGTFEFWDQDLENLSGKTKQAFSHGFLGTSSFGWGTLVTIAEISPAQLAQVKENLATYLVSEHGAPDLKSALPAAREEIEFAASLCAEHDVNTLLAIQRDFDGSQITENFKVIRPPSAADHDDVKIWSLVADDAK